MLILIVLFIVFTFPTFLFSKFKVSVIDIRAEDIVTVLGENKKQIIPRFAEVGCLENGQPCGMNAKQFTNNEIFEKTVFCVPTDIG